MTRDQLELVLAREGLTRPQTHAVLQAADQYATTQAHLAIVTGRCACDVHYLLGSKIACGKTNEDVVNTTVRDRVTCAACKETPAWRVKPIKHIQEGRT